MGEMAEMERDFDAMQAQSDEMAQLKRKLADAMRQLTYTLEKVESALGWIPVDVPAYVSLNSALNYCTLSIADRERLAEADEHARALREQDEEMRHP